MSKPKSRLVLVLMCVALTCLSCTSIKTNTTDNKFFIRDTQSRTPAVDEEFRHPISNMTFWEEFENPDPVAIPVPVLTEFFGIKYPAKSAPLEIKQMATTLRWIRENPNPAFKAIRNRRPILRIAPIPIKEPVNSVGGVQGQNVATYIVTKYDDVIEVLDKPTVFTVRNYTDKIQPSVGNFMLARDGSHYNLREKPWMRQMLPREDLPRVRQLVRSLAQKAIEEGSYIAESPVAVYGSKRHYARIELVNKLARRVPIQLTQQYFGFNADEHSMYRWSRATQFDFFHNVTNEPAIRNEAVQAGQEMQRFVRQLVEQRKRDLINNPNMDDILSRLIKNRNSEALRDIINTAHITDGRITTNVIGLLVGNVETTEAAVVQSLEVLFQNPEMLQKASSLGYYHERHKDKKGQPLPCADNEEKCFDTNLIGNNNEGHEYGVRLSDYDKRALIEYLKILPPEDEYSW